MKHTLKNISFMTGFLWKYNPFVFLFFFLCGVFQALRYVSSIYFIGKILDAVASATAIDQILPVVLAYVIILLICELFTIFTNYYTEKVFSSLSLRMTTEMMAKALVLDFRCFDDPDFYDKKTRALRQADGAIQRLAGTYISLFSSVITIVSIVSLIQVLTQNILFFLISCVSVFVSYVVLSKNNKLEYEKSVILTRARRHTNNYLAALFWSSVTLKELRMFDSGDFFIDYYSKEQESNIGKTLKYCHKTNSWLYLEALVASLASLSVMLLVSKDIIGGLITLGSFMSIVNAVTSLTQQLNTLVANVPSLGQQSRYIDDLRAILNEECTVELPDDSQIPLSGKDGYLIEFNNVTFTYPNCDYPTLKNLSFVIHPKEHVCLVGENGAGKTTITKLLFRLYDPQEGNILIDGKDIKSYDLVSLRKQMAVVFQDGMLYADTLKTNLTFGASYSDAEMSSALDKVQMSEKFADNPKGFNVQLSRIFDKKGIVLSGGEEQRLFLARALLRSSKILVLDEPSNSLDPIMERDLIEDILSTTQDRSMIIVSHRLVFCRKADRILVIENGSITEEGTHEDLMSRGGLYAEMYTAQSSCYE